MEPQARHDYIGRRVATYRRLRGWTQQQLADRMGHTRGYQAQLESGARALLDFNMILGFAEVLGVSTAELTRAPVAGRSRDEAELHAAAPKVRAALDGVLNPEYLDPDQLRQTLRTVMHARMACDYGTLASHLPQVMASSLHLADQDTRWGELAAAACATAAKALRPIGYEDLGVRLAERGLVEAAKADDPIGAAASRFALAQAAMSSGIHGYRDWALRLSDTTIEALAGRADEDSLCWLGFAHLNKALIKAASGNLSTALDHADEAHDLAAQVSGNPWCMDFGKHNVNVWRLATLVEGGEYGKAIVLSRKIPQQGLRTVQRKAHLYTHAARAYYGAEDFAGATRALLEADKIAASEVRWRASVRDMTGSMVRDGLRGYGTPELRTLATKIGLDPLEVDLSG